MNTSVSNSSMTFVGYTITATSVTVNDENITLVGPQVVGLARHSYVIGDTYIWTTPNTNIDSANIFTINPGLSNPSNPFYQGFSLIDGVGGLIIILLIASVLLALWAKEKISLNNLITSIVGIIIASIILGTLLGVVS